MSDDDIHKLLISDQQAVEAMKEAMNPTTTEQINWADLAKLTPFPKLIPQGKLILEDKVTRFWEFNVPHEELIDAGEIARGLTRENPLIICKGFEVVAMFHRSLVVKAELLGIDFYHCIDETISQKLHYSILDKDDKYAVKKVTAWAKKVKHAKWGSIKSSETISVITPKI